MLAGALQKGNNAMALYKRGKTYWISFTAPDGKRIRCSAGTSNRQKAQQLFDKLKHEAWNRKYLGIPERHTWDEAALLWIREKTDKKSLKDDVSMLRWLTPFLRSRYLDEIIRPMIARIGEIKKAESTPARANRYLSLLRAIFNRAVKIWEWLPKAPTITLYWEPKLRVRYLTPEEIRRVFDELPDHQKPIFTFSIMTGLRRSNVLNLRWDQVDFMQDAIIISGDEMKAGKTHVVPMSATAKQILMDQVGKHPQYVFTYRGRRIGDIKTALRKALKRTGITDYRWHDNRHTWASILIQNGVPLNELQEMGAWNSAEMVKRYAHLSPQKLKENAQVVDNILASAVTTLSQPTRTLKGRNYENSFESGS